MKAVEYKIQLVVTAELTVLDGFSLDEIIDEMRDRIKSQLSGHRTPKRLAEYVEVSSQILSSQNREVS